MATIPRPGFPGDLGRVRTADQLEYDGERRVGDRRSRLRMEFADRVGRYGFPNHRGQFRAGRGTSRRVLSRSGNVASVPGRAPLARLRDRCRDRLSEMGARSSSQRARGRPPPEEHPGHGNSSDRRRVGVRLFRKCRRVLPGCGRHGAMVVRDRGVRYPAWLGHGGLSGPVS